jgi:hypothetical protein
MQLSDSVYVVDVQDVGVPVEGAVVVLMGDRGEYGVGVTGSDGLATVNYRPKGLGWVDLVVNGEDYFVYEDSMEVVGAGGLCYVSSVSVDDGGGWVGNGDGEAGWGERVGLGVGLVNGGSGTLTGVGCDLSVVSGCSLFVSIAIDDSIRNDSLIYVGSESVKPGSMPFGLSLNEEVLGRGLGSQGNELGCWLWLDGMGWHVRFIGEGDPHTYACSLSIFGDLLGYSGYMVESSDTVALEGSMVVFEGLLGVGDYEDGVDLVLSDSAGVEVYVSHVDYGSVGSSEVVGWYDVGFGGGGVGDELGIWFEAEISDDGVGSWRDWFRLLIHDGEVVGERIEFTPLGGDTIGVVYGLRNVGSGGLEGLEGRLRGLSGVEVTDSVSVYGAMSSGGYGEGDGFKARELGGPVVYEFYTFDGYGRSWVDTVDVRTVSGISTLRHRLMRETVELSWEMSGDSLLYGYDIYRSDESAGSYSMIGMVEGYSRYVDDGLLTEESYYYYVCARDSMGNVSVPSETLEVWTGPPCLTGWPVTTTNVIPSSTVLADIDNDNDLEIIMGSKNGNIYVWHHDGTEAAGWPKSTGATEVWSTPSATNLDGDPELEIVVGNEEGNVYAWHHDGTGLRLSDGYFRPTGGVIRGGVATDDLDNDLDLEIVAGNSYGDLYAWHADGTGFLQSNGFFAGIDGVGHNISGTPAMADLDDDGDVEIVVGSLNGDIWAWHHDGTGYLDTTGNFTYAPGVYGAVSIGDIDNNGVLDIVCTGLYSGKVYAFDNVGSVRSGFPEVLDCGMYCSPALADLDGDEKLDIVVGTFRGDWDDTASVYVIDHNGDIRPGWPQRIEGDFFSSPVVGDIDGDSDADIVVASTDGGIYAWHKDGTRVHGWPRHVVFSFYATTAIGDVDVDGDVEIVVGGYDGMVHAYDITAPYLEDTMEWPKIYHDLHNSCLYKGPSRAGTEPPKTDMIPRELLLFGYPSPARSAVSIRLGIPSTQGSPKVSVDIYDVRGRLVKQVHDGGLDPGFHEFKWEGQDEYNTRVSSGIYFIKVSRSHQSKSRKIVLVR